MEVKSGHIYLKVHLQLNVFWHFQVSFQKLSKLKEILHYCIKHSALNN